MTRGDFIGIGTSVVRQISKWSPDAAEQYAKTRYKAYISMYKYDGERLGGPWDLIELGGIPPPIGRPKFQQFLFDQAVARGIEVIFSKRVDKYYENLDINRAGVVMASGEILEADIVVAADGVGSRSWQITTGNEDHNKPRSSGYAVYRATFPTSVGHENPLVAQEYAVTDGRDDMRMYLGPDTHAITVTSKKNMTWLLTHKVSLPQRQALLLRCANTILRPSMFAILLTK